MNLRSALCAWDLGIAKGHFFLLPFFPASLIHCNEIPTTGLSHRTHLYADGWRHMTRGARRTGYPISAAEEDFNSEIFEAIQGASGSI